LVAPVQQATDAARATIRARARRGRRRTRTSDRVPVSHAAVGPPGHVGRAGRV